MTRPAVLRLLALLLLLLPLGGCRLAVDVGVDLDRDGGGSIALSLRQDAELTALAEQVGTDPMARLVERVEALDGWRAAEEGDSDEDGERVVGIRTAFASPEEFQRRWQDLTAALDAPEGRLLGPLSVAVDEEAGTVAVDGSLAAVVTEVAAADAGTDVAALTAQLQDAVAVALSVRTPGTPLQADGEVAFDDPTAAEGPATVTWAVPAGGEVAVGLVAERGGVDWPALALPIGGGLLAVLLVAGGVAAHRRR